MQVAYMRSFTSTDYGNAKASSDAIGYGRTSSMVLERELYQLYEAQLTTIAPPEGASFTVSRWNIYQIENLIETLGRKKIDAVLLFHSTSPDAAFVRRTLDEIGYTGTVIGYTHGSHWDPSDVFRYETYPKLKWADLGILLSLDRILLASEYIRTVISDNIRAEATGALNEFLAKSRIVGIPIDIERIDRNRTCDRSMEPRLLFNHSFISSKGAEQFVKMLPVILDCNKALTVDITRAPLPGSQLEKQMRAICRKFGARVRMHEGLDPNAYAALLWKCTHQISTATHETFGIATAEAMAAGVACLLPNHAAYPELVNHSTKDSLYDPSEPLLSLNKWIRMNEDTRQNIAAHQSDYVRTQFNGKAVARAVYEVIENAS